MRRVSELGCLLCEENGYPDTPAEVHHCGTGAGGRKDHMKVVPLCPHHHRWKEAIDKTGKNRSSIEKRLLAKVRKLLTVRE